MTIHLFRKDLRRLWMPVLAVSAVALLYCIARGHVAPRFVESSARWRQLAELLSGATLFGWAFLIVLAVQEDGLTESDEDWLTRPIGWRRLLLAKLLFVAAAVMLPMALSECCILWAQGFSPWLHLPGIFTQVLLTTAMMLLPALALATVTKNLAQAVMGGFLVVLATAALNASGLLSEETLGETEWVRTLGTCALAALAAASVTLWQYVTRRAVPARIAAALATVIVMVTPSTFSWAGAHSMDQLRWDDPAGLRVRIGEPTSDRMSPRIPDTWQLGESSAWVYLPLEVSGIQPSQRLRGGGGQLELTAPDGERLQTRHLWAEFLLREVQPDGRDRYGLAIDLPKGFYQRHAGDPLRLSGELTFGIVAAGTPVTVRPGQPAVEVPGVGLCGAYYSSANRSRQLYLDCRAPYRTAAALEAVLHRPGLPDVYSERQKSGQGMFGPLAAELGLNPMVESFATWVEPSGAGEVIATPLAAQQTARRGITASGIRLKDFYLGR